MYLAHYAVALGAKKASPGTSLGTLIAASQLIDLVWPLLVLTGAERVAIDPGNTLVTPLHFVHYPFSHSLLSVLVWACLFAGLYWLPTRNRVGTLTVWLAVLSHWVLDFLSHAPDLPLYPGSDKLVGLGLWNSPGWTLLLELGLFALGLFLYRRTARPLNRTGRYALWALVVFLLGTYFLNVLGPPPPGERAVALAALLLWLLVPWGYWIDRNRASRLRGGFGSSRLRLPQG